MSKMSKLGKTVNWMLGVNTIKRGIDVMVLKPFRTMRQHANLLRTPTSAADGLTFDQAVEDLAARQRDTRNGAYCYIFFFLIMITAPAPDIFSVLFLPALTLEAAFRNWQIRLGRPGELREFCSAGFAIIPR
jgi:hypothetical protein